MDSAYNLISTSITLVQNIKIHEQDQDFVLNIYQLLLQSHSNQEFNHNYRLSLIEIIWTIYLGYLSIY
jgi:hypothetical protein